MTLDYAPARKLVPPKWMPYYQCLGSTIYYGDARVLPLADESVQCVVTSPPYWGLRDYGTGQWEGGKADCDHRVRNDSRIETSTLGGGKATTGHQREGYKSQCLRCGALRSDRQIGLEKTPEEYVARLVEVFREVRRVLREDGTLWLNLGDSYARDPGKGGSGPNGKNGYGETYTEARCALRGMQWDDASGVRTYNGEASRESTSEANTLPYVRARLENKQLIGIPWRVAFALQADGWYLRSDIIWHKPNPMPESVTDRPTKAHEYLFLLTKNERYYYDSESIKEPAINTEVWRFTDNGKDKQRGHSRRHAGFNGRYAERLALEGPPETRNKRSVWTVATRPYPEAHFATFPPSLIEPCILAGCPERGLVLDPFGGSGTTLSVAHSLNRQGVMVELKQDYCDLAIKRLNKARGVEW